MPKMIGILLVAFSIFSITHPAYAQERGKPARIGTLLSGSPKTHGHNLDWFRKGMQGLGYVEGRDYVIVSRWAMGKRQRLPKLAKELVAAKVDVILTAGGASIRASGRATSEIPIVVGSATNLGGYGFVDSFARPGGNVTGSTFEGVTLYGKQLGIFREVLPKAHRVVFLQTGSVPKRQRRELKRMKTAGRKLGFKIQGLEANKVTAIRSTFKSNGDPDALIFGPSPEFNSQRQSISALGIERKIPILCPQEAYVQAGCLMSYTVDRERMWRRAASYVGRILKGARPAELPVELEARYKLVINLKTAKALGLEIPRSILLQATKVIE